MVYRNNKKKKKIVLTRRPLNITHRGNDGFITAVAAASVIPNNREFRLYSLTFCFIEIFAIFACDYSVRTKLLCRPRGGIFIFLIVYNIARA